MKRLFLMRHAKSDYPPGVDDHDRPLNRRGRLASTLMGAYLVEERAVPDLVYASSAARAQETWDRMLLDVPAETRPQLYHASAEAALVVARRAPESVGSLMLVWHQPGIRDAANRLTGGHDVPDFPTAQIVTLEFDADRWWDVGFGAGRLVAIAAPKDLV